jgi:hypothetical protein
MMSHRAIAGIVLCIGVLVVAIATPFIVTKAETFEAWATGWAAVATMLAIVIGGLWAAWRYIVPRPFEPTWDVVMHDCSVREQEPGRLRYTVEVLLTNTSDIPYRVEEISLGMLFPDEPLSAARLETVAIGTDLHGVFRPNVQRRFASSRAAREEDETLHQLVTVIGQAKFWRPRYFGFWGRRNAIIGFNHVRPVDSESLALYMDSSKKQTSDQ